jgi:hypothetical protein
LWIADPEHRTVVTLDGPLRLTLRVRRWINRACSPHQRPCRSPDAGRVVLAQSAFGLDVIALIGPLR